MTDDNRKFGILYSIICDYIATGEPVGSRTIEKKYDLGVSSATIRNEMSDLEELGYLVQPHTSAGRIPTQKAYRLYVDKFMKLNDVSAFAAQMVRKAYNEYAGEWDEVIEKTADLLSELTGLTALITTPHIAELNIRDIKLIHIDSERVLMVIITKQGIVKTSQIRLSIEPDNYKLSRVEHFLNTCLKDMDTGFTVASFTGGINALEADEQKILSDLLYAIRKILDDNNKDRIYQSGETLILNYPEFQDTDKAKRLLSMLNKQELLSYLLYECLDEGINIRIGDENEIEEFSDCSLLMATYKFNNRPVGTIGLIGPTRMDYDNAVSTIHFLTNELSEYFNDMIGGKNK